MRCIIIIVRGIARGRVFADDADRDFFIERIGVVLSETETHCLAWALIPNHFHLLLKTGATPIAAVMKRLLTGYAMHYNRRHRRNGHLFRNRYKSILCQEDAYLLELVRYIHLNPLRAKLVATMKELGKNRYSGYGVLLGHVAAEWQNTAYVLRLSGDKLSAARRCYREFVQKGVGAGRRGEFSGGGLTRSAGGWSAAKSLRKAGALQKGDERILGDGEFVQKVLAQANEALEKKYRLKAKGITIDGIAARVAEIVDLVPADVWSGGKQPKVVKARSLLCYWATSELGVSQVWLCKKLGLTQAAISLSVARGRHVARQNKYEIGNL